MPTGFDIQNFASATAADFKCAPQYHYRFAKLAAGDVIALPDWQTVIVFIPTPGQTQASATVNDIYQLRAGDSLTLGGGGQLTAASAVIILMAGTDLNAVAAPLHKTYADHYKVVKPWGHELWLNGEDPIFNFKEVHLRQGHQTSLQYHNFKQESNFLFSGTSDLVFKQNDAVANDDATDADLGVMELAAMTLMYIEPPALHRLVAKTDLYLYEAATPYLDDVFRVQDDAARGHGRISAEHRKTA